MTVTWRQGKFIINGQETFLYGAEFHYYRVPQAEWSQRLDKIIEAGCNLVSTYVPWIWHEYEEGAFDFTGETRGERDLKSFLKLVKDKGLYCIVRPGPYVMAEVKNEGIPGWLLENYPQVIAKQRSGADHPTRVVSYQHPLFLEKVKNWYSAVNKVIAPMQINENGSVIMYQLCNEIGMLHWVTNTSDYNEDTLQKFAVYLEGQYQTISAFNTKYGLSESSFTDFVNIFKAGLPAHYPSFHFEWRRFWRDYIKDYVNHLRSFAKQTGITVPFIVNVHGFKDFSIYSRGVDYPIGLSQLYKTAELDDVVVAGDFYPGHIGYDTYHDLILSCSLTKSISHPEQPLFSAEFQSGRLADRPRLYPQDLDLNTRTCVAHGMNALNYYMFVAGENYEQIGLFGRRHEWQAPIDSKGQERPNYAKAKHLGHLFRTIGQRLLSASKHIHTYIAFNPDDYMTEVTDERDRDMVNELAAKRETFAFDGIQRLLAAANIHYEAVDLLKELDVEKVPTLWVFSSAYMNEDIQRKLANYVQAGGRLVLYPEIPTHDLYGKPCTVLADQLQLGEWEVVPGISRVDVLGIDSVNVKQRLKFSQYDGEVIAAFTEGAKPEVAAYTKRVGKGQILVLGIGMGHDYHYQLEVIKALAEVVGVRPHLTASDPDLSLVERTNGSDSFIFINNYDEVEKTAVIYEHGSPLFDGETITLPPRSGAVFVRYYRLNDDITIRYATVELTDLYQETGKIELRVIPIGRQGSIALTMEGKWRSNLEEQPIHGKLKIEGITDPLTLILTKDREDG
ncbi:beta-galactosidase [Caldalkalibacillus uzonensis]|uniref:Beta-galactosidase n=1 Tax=Caldalkalibacillus uzonensis TaxID=353224 RepID=A0ABU0CQH4_9BACI|nr:beta-galactosidase [Caldalkalibacillus uzonensis]MDQ0338662.1 beta-galactosidase [Caldalkalibacillus uzonensis]